MANDINKLRRLMRRANYIHQETEGNIDLSKSLRAAWGFEEFRNALKNGFARFRSKGISLAFGFIIVTMLIPEIVTARPLYEFMRKVKLYDTYLGLIILYISSVIPFTVLVLKNFVTEIPISLEEAAAIDGATFLQRFFMVVLPLMRPAVATVCIINFISSLNNFFTPLYYSNNIQVLSVSIVMIPLKDNNYGLPWDLISAMGWIILLPIIIFVAIFEQQIMDGIMAGGVKA